MTMPGVSPSLGAYLRGLREGRTGSLDEMAHATRVSVSQLVALECDNLAELPAPVFVKGFIRAYCHYLDEPADEALGLYRDMRGQPPVAEGFASSPRLARSSFRPSPIVISLALLVVSGGGLLALNLGGRHGPKSAGTPIATQVNVEPAATSTVSEISAPVSPASQSLIVKAVESTWIRIQADDGTVDEALLAPGATREWTAQRRFFVTIGNAGGIELTLNGQPVPPLGARGVVIRRLELPPQAVPAAGS
jgi:cytoskeleton protein RodZ